jgi:hypothetical protein
LLGEVDDTHPAFADPLENSIRAEPLRRRIDQVSREIQHGSGSQNRGDGVVGL